MQKPSAKTDGGIARRSAYSPNSVLAYALRQSQWRLHLSRILQPELAVADQSDTSQSKV